MLWTPLVTGAILLAGCTHGPALPARKAPPARVQWWQNQKFGLFIHWGPWAQTGKGEIWPIVDKRTSAAQRARYFDLYKTFNPAHFDPRRWMRLARRAGMRYVVFTTKHHDGFCNFDTATTDYRVTAPACPFSHRPDPDITARVVAAARAAGFGVGLYFSHYDWHNPDGAWHRARWDYIPDMAEHAPARWRRFVAYEKTQVKELMTHYGKIDILWFDGNWRKSGGQTDVLPMLQMVRKLQPGILMDDRGTLDWGDFRTFEQKVPKKPPQGPWETNMTVSKGPGYWYNGPHAQYKSTGRLIRTLVKVVARGGNLLLDVGPRGDGRIAEPAIARLRGIGDWLAKNGDAIYGTRPGGFHPAWGYVTRKPGALFALVTRWPANGRLQVPLGQGSRVKSATLLATGAPLALERGGHAVLVKLPADSPDPDVSVIRLALGAAK